MPIAFLLLGTNMGNRLQNLRQAVREIALHQETIRVIKLSSIYETAAWGKLEQDDYLNQALKIETTLSPQQLLEVTASVETAMGRTRKKVWEPRIIDIDIIFYNQLIIKEKTLTLPHPHLQERRFVLMPLAEIAAGFIHPVFKKSVRSLLTDCPDPLWVKRYDTVNT